MRIFSLICLMMLSLINSAFAIAPLNQASIQQAQLYGSSQAKVELAGFLKPWLSYEEKAEQLNEKSEMAYLYTPFLLIAMDAREKRLDNTPIRIEDSEKVITDYLGTLSFSVKLYGETTHFSRHTTGVISQNGKVIKAWSTACPESAEAVTWHEQGKYMAQGYFYFAVAELDSKEPIMLVITTGDQKIHRFYFELAKIK